MAKEIVGFGFKNNLSLPEVLSSKRVCRGGREGSGWGKSSDWRRPYTLPHYSVCVSGSSFMFRSAARRPRERIFECLERAPRDYCVQRMGDHLEPDRPPISLGKDDYAPRVCRRGSLLVFSSPLQGVRGRAPSARVERAFWIRALARINLPRSSTLGMAMGG